MVLPDYSGPPISTRPPFQFSNVVVSCFPLRASIDTLQRFIDGYLNIIPPELGYFRVALPYVNLMLLDYGKLSAQATNFGWFSQREVIFDQAENRMHTIKAVMVATLAQAGDPDSA